MAEARSAALPGFGVLFETELLDARRSRRLIAFLLIMTIVVALIPVIAYVNADNYADSGRHLLSDDAMDGLVGTWAALVGFMGSLMVIAATVDALTHERSIGVTAWIITKPVSRLSYLLAKAMAHAVVASVTVVIIPTLVWFVLTVLLFQGVSIPAIAGAALILCIEMTFLSFFVIAIGVAFRSVAPIAIIALAGWFIPTVVPVIASLDWTYRVLPSYLPVAAVTAAISQAEALTFTIPIASLLIGAAVFAVAVISFERQEL
jgi:ABC-2 type transport system permease protein